MSSPPSVFLIFATLTDVFPVREKVVIKYTACIDAVVRGTYPTILSDSLIPRFLGGSAPVLLDGSELQSVSIPSFDRQSSLTFVF